jgi:RNA polymerase sigma-70 factor (ECF subfamily)
MSDTEWLAEEFEGKRPHLRGVAYRMLGSLPDAEDAVQEAWLRLSRADRSSVDNLGGWLTTVVGRVCLDMLRARKSRREESLDPDQVDRLPGGGAGRNPEQEQLLANSVGLALLVILDTLDPAERLAFVLHDMFGLPFEDIAPVVERSVDATRQLASRARRRVQGSETPHADAVRQRTVVEAYLAAARDGNFDALMTLLDPGVVLRADGRVVRAAGPVETRDAAAIASQAIKAGARAADAALINGQAGFIVAPRGKLLMAVILTIAGNRIVAMEAIAEPERLRGLELTVLERPSAR